MAKNFIERAITPYNRSDNKLIQKQGYSLYAPVATNGKAGIAAFAEHDFDVVDGIVRLRRDDLQLADILLWNINENRRQLIEKSKYLLKLVLKSSDAFPKLQNATFVIPTDTAYDTSIMPGISGNNVFELFYDTLRPVFNFECHRNSGLISLTYNTDMACWYAGVVELVDNHYTTIPYILYDGVEVVHEELIERESSGGSGGSGGNGTGGIVREVDPTVPAWAKQPNKPTYTASEVGAASADALTASLNTEASARATEISGERTQRMNMDNHIRENAVFGVELSGQDLVFRNDHGVELQNNRITLPVSSGGGGSAVATLPLRYFRISDSTGYNIVKISDGLYGARLLLTSEGASCTNGMVRKVSCANWSEVPIQDFTVVVGDSPLHTDYYYKWDYNTYSEIEVEGLAYMVKVTLNRSSGLLTITTTSRNYLSYFPEFDYYVELEVNTAIKRAMVRVTQLKIY